MLRRDALGVSIANRDHRPVQVYVALVLRGVGKLNGVEATGKRRLEQGLVELSRLVVRVSVRGIVLPIHRHGVLVVVAAKRAPEGHSRPVEAEGCIRADLLREVEGAVGVGLRRRVRVSPGAHIGDDGAAVRNCKGRQQSRVSV